MLLFTEQVDPPRKGKRHARQLARTLKKLERLQEERAFASEMATEEYFRMEELSELDATLTEELAASMSEIAELAEWAALDELEELAEFDDFSPEEFATYDEVDSLLPAMDFSGIKQLEADVEWGTIILTKSPDALVHVKERSQHFAIEDNNGTLSVTIQRATQNEESPGKRGRRDRKNCVAMMNDGAPLEISLPEGVDAQIHNSNGEIIVRDLATNKVELTSDMGEIVVTNVAASLMATTYNGDLTINQLTGTIMARAYFGNLHLSEGKGTTSVYSSSGDVYIDKVIGDLSVQSDFGDATIKHIIGRAIINCNSGMITADSIVASQLKINSNFGDVIAKDITAPTEIIVNSGGLSVDEITGDLTVRSQFGEVDLDDVKGNLFVYGNSGNIRLSDLDGNLVVESVFGNIDFSHTKGNVSITANSGNVSGDDVLVSEKLSVEVDFGNSEIELENEANDLRFDVEATMGTVSISKGDLQLKKDEGHIITDKGAITIKGVSRSGSVSFD